MKPFRCCPVCRIILSKIQETDEHGKHWEVYECPNCGSEVWIVPFRKVKGK